MKYKCTIISGGGSEYDGGIWEKKETERSISFELTKEPFFEPNYKKIKCNKYYKSRFMGKEQDGYFAWFNNGNVIRDWKDGTYTAYPMQCGIPYLFELIN